MKRSRKIILFASLSLFSIWILSFSILSFKGSYHEVTSPGGIQHAIWYASDLTARKFAPERPADASPSRRRYYPQTVLPVQPTIHSPLLILDRWIIHPTVQTVSGSGDMKRLYVVSDKGELDESE